MVGLGEELGARDAGSTSEFEDFRGIGEEDEEFLGIEKA